jgi:hypothetical protein
MLLFANREKAIAGINENDAICPWVSQLIIVAGNSLTSQ